ncbi:vesicle formation at the endoplasmic reticulum [Aspergillus brasiliensis]|uniref:tripeptidyl-peptidase II n=1 Tax=Aspergillus brasiliensis TaxID=319629 RepID=A0A9W5YWB5_9EURO|nr:vesicle formation at the endoplasmic reticulum [Aspergillus brasiliensis]GKZ49016.1 vesicle formation at the endoplasmic reticulum [Aspergillus brasiliensis]
MRSSGLYTALLCSLAASTNAIVHEKLAAVPSGWQHVEDAGSDHQISLSIALARKNLDQLESKLKELSTPGESQYGQWLDQEDVDALFPVASDEAVISWLRSANITHIARQGSLVNFATTVDKVNKLLKTTFAYYQSGSSQRLRTTEYSIPDDLADSIDLISPTTFFGKETTSAGLTQRAQKIDHHVAKRANSSSCADLITLSCLKEMYNFGNYTPSASSGSRLGFSSFLNESASYADLAKFEKLFNVPGQNFSVELINGGVNDQNASTASLTEADLDVELLVGVGHPLPVTEFITSGEPPFIPDPDEPSAADNENEPYLQYYEYLLSKPNSALPHVISNSYGDDEQTVPEYYAKRVCNLIGLVGLRGISVLVSSGDEGIGSGCRTTDGTNSTQFNPIFPATCPYVTAVGGTMSYAPEIAWEASSGGFSNYFERAWFQKEAVQNYLAHHITNETKQYYSHFANFSGRGFPDVAAHSFEPSYEVIFYGTRYGSGGTSAACPLFSALMGMLNDARLRAGKSTLGFLNPLLYSKGYRALTDVTAGQSIGCNGIDPQSDEAVAGAGIIPWAHWNATVGWDPVTGLGLPDFEKLRQLVLSL